MGVRASVSEVRHENLSGLQVEEEQRMVLDTGCWSIRQKVYMYLLASCVVVGRFIANSSHFDTTDTTALLRGGRSSVRALRCLRWMSSSSSSKAKPAISSSRQKTLNKFLGLQLEQIQTKVDSLWRKQARLQQEGLHTSSAISAADKDEIIEMSNDEKSGDEGSKSNNAMKIDDSSDVEAANTSKTKANGNL